ncbi:transposase [Cytobacillus firmus]|uniref:Transposase IS200-like domain-containing protein n=1 Tax=Cytobacillus firmus DS1 TaxID=1307436 RepID=W7L2X5_CYTFI|nr:transposase [Cytobacillus firmus]EWG09956.1 hypothetical protein PBF_16294 [Cytobacillus firmus DS1]
MSPFSTVTLRTTSEKYKKNCELFIYAWCMMNNHVHLLIKEGNEDISASMKRSGVSYVGYYNWKYRTTDADYVLKLFSDDIKAARSRFKDS